jgi:uncharacterized protein (TIGR01244 family)
VPVPFHELDSSTLAGGQIAPGDVAGLARAGVVMIVNNRPDGEEAGQPAGAAIEAAAQAAGLAYRHIPVAGQISPAQVEAMVEALDAAGEGKVLAFCRSGRRSAILWSLASARRAPGGA